MGTIPKFQRFNHLQLTNIIRADKEKIRFLGCQNTSEQKRIEHRNKNILDAIIQVE